MAGIQVATGELVLKDEERRRNVVKETEKTALGEKGVEPASQGEEKIMPSTVDWS